LRVEAEIKVGQASAAGVAVARRLGTGGWLVILASMALALVWCWAIGYIDPQIERLLSIPDAGRGLFRLVFGLGGVLLIWPLFARRLLVLRYRRRIADRGHVGPFRTSYEITDEAMVYVIGGITRIVRWSAASEIFRTKGWWVLIAQGEPLYIPPRAFTAQGAERAFIAAMLARMPEAARARSKDAVAFAAEAA
jgi:hypothetical protein